MSKVKILVCGGVSDESTSKAAVDKVVSTAARAGPFQLAFFVPSSSSSSNDLISAISNASSLNQVSVVVGYPLRSIDDADDDAWHCPSHLLLIEPDTIVQVAGLVIAATPFDTTPPTTDAATDTTATSTTNDDASSRYVSGDAVGQVRVLGRTTDPAYDSLAVDVVLSTVWPLHISRYLDPATVPTVGTKRKRDSNGESDGSNESDLLLSAVVAQAVHRLSPQYHFASGSESFFERAPYANSKSSSKLSNTPSFTRFFGIAPACNTQNQKWLYATMILPLEAAPVADRPPEQPLNLTPSPFEEVQPSGGSTGGLLPLPEGFGPPIKRARLPETPAFAQMAELPAFSRWSADPLGHRGGRGGRGGARGGGDFSRGGAARGGGRGGGAQVQAAPPKIESCWFCLDSPKVERHLVVSIGDESYLALAKGGLVPYHVLILPIQHVTNPSELKVEVDREMERYKKALRRMAAKNNEQLVFFERSVPTKFGAVHMHIQCVPLAAELVDGAKAAFLAAGERQHIRFEDVEADVRLAELAGDRWYFAVELHDGTRMVHWVANQERHPLQFGRVVLAELMGRPERADWKACAVPKPEESQIASDFKRDFKPFDFTL